MAANGMEEKEKHAVELMIKQNLTPRVALRKAGLNYEHNSKGYHRVFGMKRRRLRAQKKAAMTQQSPKHTVAMALMTDKRLTPKLALEKAGLQYRRKDSDYQRLVKQAQRQR